MNLPQQRERVTVDGLGNIGVGKYKVTNNIHKPNVKNSTVGSVANSGNSGIISDDNKKTVENDVHSIGKIDIEKYKCVTEDIRTDEVIITDKQIEHIKFRHPIAMQ